MKKKPAGQERDQNEGTISQKDMEFAKLRDQNHAKIIADFQLPKLLIGRKEVMTPSKRRACEKWREQFLEMLERDAENAASKK